jgi:L-2-hydroxyglutarate oxidase
MEAFCTREEIPFEICGKVIVAVDESELPALQKLYERGQANDVACEMIDANQLRVLEPHARGVRAIHVKETGIVSYRQVSERLAERVRERDGHVVNGAKAIAFERRTDAITAITPRGEFTAAQIVNCAGLYSDRIASLTGKPPGVKIIPFRGEYYELRLQTHHLVRNLIYPVPDAKFPFLGVHFTRMIDGRVECGPNAVLAFAREGYTKRTFNLQELAESLSYPGLVRIALKHWRMGMGEMWRSISKKAFVRALQRLLPEIRPEHLEPAPAGVRAQAVLRNGTLVDDFLIEESHRVVNVLNAPSPAATSSLNIGELIVEKLAERIAN